MHCRPIRLCLAAMLAIGGLCVAQSRGQATTNPTAPTQPPATEPASAPVVPVDTATPRGTLKTLLTAIQNGDPETIKKIIYTATPTEEKMLDAMAHRVTAEKKFREAASKAFGGEGAKELVGDGEASLAATLSQLDAATETIDGDTATVVAPDGRGDPFKLKKVNGKWQIAASDFSRDVDPSRIQQSIDDMNFSAKLIEQYAGDVAAGKYKTAAEAKELIQLQMRAAIEAYANSRGAATLPATAPASGPG